MTNGFAFVSIIALISYLFLFLTFIAAKRTKIINEFMLILITMILWTGGSFFMRAQFFPGVKFWYDVSILGLTLCPYVSLLFAVDFAGIEIGIWRKIWLILAVAANAFNIITGSLLAAPEVVTAANGTVSFIYETTWKVIFLYGVTFGASVHMFFLLWKHGKKDEMLKRQMMPIELGLLIMYAGNVVIFLPPFVGVPVDIMTGIVNVFCLVYALYARRMFRLTLLASKGSCYLIAGVCSLAIFSNIIFPLRRLIDRVFPAQAEYDILFVSVIFMVATIVIYTLMKLLIDKLFIRDELARAEILKEFSSAVSKSLKINEILDVMVHVIQTTIGVKKVYVCLINNTGDQYQVSYSTSPLDKRSYALKADNPVVLWLKYHTTYLLMKDFRRTVAYKSMWETEKQLLKMLDIECVVPLKDENQLVGFVMITEKEKRNILNADDLAFLDSVGSIGSIAVKNSHLYEKVYMEARIDELTGLLNRKYFYETLEEEVEKNKHLSLSLLMVSIDDFKLYNQLYGTEEGDKALKYVAAVLQACVGENGYVARYNGKEFAVILPQFDILAAKNMANNIRMQIMDINKQNRGQMYRQKALTASVGICSIPYAASNMKQLMDNADMALYQAKHTGKNKVVIYSIGEVEDARANHLDNGTGYREGIYSEYASTIYALTAAIDTKDHYTFNHSKNVAEYATKLAKAYGLNNESVSIIHEAALLHDIGKIGIPEHILNKPGRLEAEEYEVMKEHVENSIGIIRHLPSLDYVIPAVIGHHERWDGRGYPRRIAGEDIPLSARILCIADSFDAMVSRRSYKDAYDTERALSIVRNEAGRQFDPQLAELFVTLVENGTITVLKDE
ncbi:diguanylate cyclase domain-containing protein [Anaerotignum sp.]